MKQALISGASFAGLSTAYWLKQLGYQVTVVETAAALKKGGTAVDIKGNTVAIVKRMGIFEQIRDNRLNLQRSHFMNAAGEIENTLVHTHTGDAFEIERDKLLDMLCSHASVEILFNTRISAMTQDQQAVAVTLSNGTERTFDLVFGCDGVHSAVRKLCFGPEAEFLHFLGHYFSVTIVNKLLVEQDTMQLYNAPGKGVMLNAYRGKTDIVFMFVAEQELVYDYRNEQQQREIIRRQLAGQGWRTDELVNEVMQASSFYFDKLCQVRMPAWSKGRVVLVGDSAYCPSPAAGMGGSLAIDGAAALADALKKHGEDFPAAFADYDKTFRPFVEEIQAEAVNTCAMLIPRTEEEIRLRNSAGGPF